MASIVLIKFFISRFAKAVNNKLIIKAERCFRVIIISIWTVERGQSQRFCLYIYREFGKKKSY